MAGFVETTGRNPFASRETPVSPRMASSTTPYISRTFRWSPFDGEDRPPTLWRAPQQTPETQVPMMKSEGRPEVAKKVVPVGDEDAEAARGAAFTSNAHSDPSSSPRTPGTSGWSARSAASWDTPGTAASINAPSPCPLPRNEAAVIAGSAMESPGELLAAVDSSSGASSDKLEVPHIQTAAAEDTPTRPLDIKRPQALPESQATPTPTPVEPRRRTRKATSPLPEQPSVSEPLPAAPATKQRPGTTLPLKPRRSRRSEVELLLDAARGFGYTDLPDSRPRVVVVGGPGPATRSARVGRKMRRVVGGQDAVMTWARGWSADVMRRRVERIGCAEAEDRGLGSVVEEAGVEEGRGI